MKNLFFMQAVAPSLCTFLFLQPVQCESGLRTDQIDGCAKSKRATLGCCHQADALIETNAYVE